MAGNNLTRLSAYCWGWWSSLCRVWKYHRSTSMVDRLLNMCLITLPLPLPQNKTKTQVTITPRQLTASGAAQVSEASHATGKGMAAGFGWIDKHELVARAFARRSHRPIQQTIHHLLLGRCDWSACRAALGQQEASLCLLCHPSLSYLPVWPSILIGIDGCVYVEPLACLLSGLPQRCVRRDDPTRNQTLHIQRRAASSHSVKGCPLGKGSGARWTAVKTERTIALLLVKEAGELDLETICRRLVVMIAFPWTGANQCLVFHHPAITEWRFTAAGFR